MLNTSPATTMPAAAGHPETGRHATTARERDPESTCREPASWPGVWQRPEIQGHPGGCAAVAVAAETTSGVATSAADSTRIEPSRLPGAFAYEHSGIPEELALHEWRERAHRQSRRHRRWLRTRTSLTETTPARCAQKK